MGSNKLFELFLWIFKYLFKFIKKFFNRFYIYIKAKSKPIISEIEFRIDCLHSRMYHYYFSWFIDFREYLNRKANSVRVYRRKSFENLSWDKIEDNITYHVNNYKRTKYKIKNFKWNFENVVKLLKFLIKLVVFIFQCFIKIYLFFFLFCWIYISFFIYCIIWGYITICRKTFYGSIRFIWCFNFFIYISFYYYLTNMRFILLSTLYLIYCKLRLIDFFFIYKKVKRVLFFIRYRRWKLWNIFLIKLEIFAPVLCWAVVCSIILFLCLLEVYYIIGVFCPFIDLLSKILYPLFQFKLENTPKITINFIYILDNCIMRLENVNCIFYSYNDLCSTLKYDSYVLHFKRSKVCFFIKWYFIVSFFYSISFFINDIKCRRYGWTFYFRKFRFLYT